MKVETRPDTHSGRGDSHGVSRRTVARGAAWATPVVLTAIAAPSYAAASGPCQTRGAGSMATDANGVVTGLSFPGGITATLAYAKKNGTKVLNAFDGETGHQFSTDYGVPWTYVRLHHPEGMKQNDTLTLTITFSQPVMNFGLTMTDIDRAKDSWIDQVTLSPETFSTTGKGANVGGTGKIGAPFVSTQEGGIDSPAGDVTLTWPGALQVFTVTYVAADKKNNSGIGQMIGIGQFAYNNCV
jgi:hypothetical protein